MIRSPRSSVLASALAVSISIAAYEYVRVAKERKRLGSFPSSSPWYLPFADLLRIIRAGGFEQFVINRKRALNADAFYIHLMGFSRRPTLVITKPADYVEIMQKEGKLELHPDMPDTIQETHGPGNLQVLTGTRHKFLRKIFVSLLHPVALEGFVPYFYEEFNKMWAKLEESGEVIIQDAICEAQFFLMVKILYGMTPENTSMGVLMNLRNDFELQLKGHFSSPNSKKHLEAKEASQRIREILNPKFNAVLEERRRNLEAVSHDKQESPVGHAMESIADTLLKDKVHTDPQILSDVYDNLNLLLEASHGTTMTVTTSALYYLNHPDNINKLKKLREEMKPYREKLPTLSDLKNGIPLADGIIKETMRLAPIVGNVTFACKNATPFTFKDQKMRGPISFMFAFAHNYSDPKYYPNPDSFVPERWVAGATEEVSDDGRAAFRPFGMGRHMCLGYKLAELVMKSSLYCFARDDRRAIKFDTDKVMMKAGIFPSFSISDGFPGTVTSTDGVQTLSVKA